MEKSHLIGVIAILLVLNLLVFSCQNDSSTQKKPAVVENPTTDTNTETVAESDATDEEPDSSTDDNSAEGEEETTMSENSEETTEEDTELASKTKSNDKPATMNTPAAPPKPKVKKPKKPATPTAKFKFDSKEHNFGTIVVGTKVEHDFYFTNTGEVPMIITDANSTCGCTIPEIPKEPTPPGARGKIKVTFDSTGKIGMQDKHVTITANTYPKNTVIHMKGLALTENMMPTKKATTASPSPYSSPKLTEPAAPATTPKKEETKPVDNNNSGTSLLPTSDKPATTPSSSTTTTPTDKKKEQETTMDKKDN